MSDEKTNIVDRSIHVNLDADGNIESTERTTEVSKGSEDQTVAEKGSWPHIETKEH